MSKFNPRLIKVRVTRYVQNTPQSVTRGGVSPARKEYFDKINVHNKSGFNLNWLNVELIQWGKDSWGTEQWYSSTVTFSGVNDTGNYEGESRNGGGASIYRISGQLANGQTFIDERKWGVDLNYKKVPKAADEKCFVTTAAYGNSQHPIVKEFRGLRDEILVNFRAGRAFIGWYNRNGPVAANLIARRPVLKRVTRGLLTPIAKSIRGGRYVIDRSPRLRSYFYNIDGTGSG
jgi:hypothetical protein